MNISLIQRIDNGCKKDMVGLMLPEWPSNLIGF